MQLSPPYCSNSKNNRFNLCFSLYLQLNYVDEVELSVVKSVLRLNFKKIFAMHVVKAMRDVIGKKCEGCILDLPSQLDHMCLNFNVLEDMHVYWADAVGSVDFGMVSFEYFTWAEAENLPPNELDLAEAFYNATGLWTDDIRGIVASFMLSH